MAHVTERRFPTASGQRRPRCLLLHPTGVPVSGALVRSMLARHPRLTFRAIGHAWAPRIPHGSVVTVAAAPAAAGDLVLCDAGDRLDLLRWLRADGERVVLALDSAHGRTVEVDAARILGVVVEPPARLPSFARRAYSLYARAAALRWWWSDVSREHVFERPAEGIESRYANEAADYERNALAPPAPAHLELWPRCFAAGSSVLVGGCGAGWEAVALARRGHRVLGVDFVPEMVAAARRAATTAGVEAEFAVGDLAECDWDGRRFDGAWLTAHLPTYIARRARRVAVYRHVRGALAPGGRMVLSCRMLHQPEQFVRAALRVLIDRRRGRAAEFGDWHSTSIDPDGTVRATFSRTFTAGQIERELREAGFTHVEREPHDHFSAWY